MHHGHVSFSREVAIKKVWSRPTLTTIALSAEDLAAARSSPERLAALGARLKAEGRI